MKHTQQSESILSSTTLHSPAQLFSDVPPISHDRGSRPTADLVSLRTLPRTLNRILRDYEGNSSLVERFDELTKIIYCKIHDEFDTQYHAPNSVFYISQSDTNDDVAERVRKYYHHLVCQRPTLFPQKFSCLYLADESIAALVTALNQYELSSSGGDLKGLFYEEIVRNTFEKGDNQQFFTPRHIVDFMVQALGPSIEGRVCDPACGTGGFLLQVQQFVQQHHDMRDVSLLGFEVDERLSWVTGVNLDLQARSGQFDVSHLSKSGSLGHEMVPHYSTMDVILTNPPFGSDLSDPSALMEFELGRNKTSRRRGVLFIERCLALLRPGGVLAIVIDDGVLNSPSNRDTRRLILTNSRVLAIVSLPESAFMPYASVKSSILFLQKCASGEAATWESCHTFFASADVVGKRSNGDALMRRNYESGVFELDSDLPEILNSWHAGATDAQAAAFAGDAKCFWADIPNSKDQQFVRDAFRLDHVYHHPARISARRALRSSPHPMQALGDLCDVRNETVVPTRELNGEDILYLGLANIEALTGSYTPTIVVGASIKSTVKRFETGDIIFGKLRPALRKICHIDADIAEGYASSECVVLTPRNACTVGGFTMLPSLLAALLRTDLVYGQLAHLITGIGRPRIHQSAVLEVRVPVPHVALQETLLQQFHESNARVLSKKAESVQASNLAHSLLSQAQQSLVNDLLNASID